MTRFCPDCGKQINDASGCICKMGKQLKEWMPKLDETKTKFHTSCPHCGESFDDDINGYYTFELAASAGAKAVLDYLITNMPAYDKPIKLFLEQMLKELEEYHG